MSKKINVSDGLNQSTFQQKLADARKLYEAGPQDPQLQSKVELALNAEIERIREIAKANPDDKFAKANQHLLLGEGLDSVGDAAAPTIETWHCGGSASLSGVAWWAVDVTVIFVPPIYPFMMNATGGPDLAASVFTSGIVGSFVVDPMTLRNSMSPIADPISGTIMKGPCRFQLGQLSGGAGAIRISFYSVDGTYWGLVGGVAAGLGVASLAGQGEIMW